jgi:hypothetical protein
MLDGADATTASKEDAEAGTAAGGSASGNGIGAASSEGRETLARPRRWRAGTAAGWCVCSTAFTCRDYCSPERPRLENREMIETIPDLSTADLLRPSYST